MIISVLTVAEFWEKEEVYIFNLKRGLLGSD